MTREVHIAIPQYWSFDALFIEAYFVGLLRRSLPGETIQVTSSQNNAYGGIGVMKCDAAIATVCEVAASRINDGMRIQDPDDRFANLRKLATEDRAERKRMQELIDEYFRSLDKK